jgi:hypothetical protein
MFSSALALSLPIGSDHWCGDLKLFDAYSKLHRSDVSFDGGYGGYGGLSWIEIIMTQFGRVFWLGALS